MWLLSSGIIKCSNWKPPKVNLTSIRKELTDMNVVIVVLHLRLPEKKINMKRIIWPKNQNGSDSKKWPLCNWYVLPIGPKYILEPAKTFWTYPNSLQPKIIKNVSNKFIASNHKHCFLPYTSNIFWLFKTL